MILPTRDGNAFALVYKDPRTGALILPTRDGNMIDLGNRFDF